MKVPFPVRALPSLAFRAWLTPPPIAESTVQRDLETLAGLEPVFFGGVPGYEAGSGPLVLAIHGWGGRAAPMAPLARALAATGHRVVVPHVPGHAGGPQTDIKQAASVVRAVVADLGRPAAVVAHSFAAMVLRLAFSDRVPDRVALIAPALDVNDALDVFGDRLDLLPWARSGLRRRLERWDPALWPTLSGLLPTQLPGAEVLILHDPRDAETPFARSAELAAMRAHTTIVPLDGAGHSKILSTQETIDHVTGFLAASELGSESAA